MSKAILIVDASVDSEVEQEWNDWYDSEHLPDILACPHFDSAARYVSEHKGQRNYLTVYTLSSEEAVKTPEFARARGWAEFKDRVRASTRLYTRLRGSGHER
jgi:Domain of unknown function (DUF4286)